MLAGRGVRRTVIVLGAGRSGTSLVAGLLADAGYFPGERLIPPSEANPTGFFEDLDVNALNDELLHPMLPLIPDPVPARLAWLAPVPALAGPRATSAQRARMASHVRRAGTCLKDPRFSFTLGAWRGSLPADTGFVCVFRHPARVAESVRREAERDPGYFLGYQATPQRVWAAWCAAYRWILDRHATSGDWLFVDADRLCESGDTTSLTGFAELDVPAGRIDPSLQRSGGAGGLAPDVSALYLDLCKRVDPPGG